MSGVVEAWKSTSGFARPTVELRATRAEMPPVPSAFLSLAQRVFFSSGAIRRRVLFVSPDTESRIAEFGESLATTVAVKTTVALADSRMNQVASTPPKKAAVSMRNMSPWSDFQTADKLWKVPFQILFELEKPLNGQTDYPVPFDHMVFTSQLHDSLTPLFCSICDGGCFGIDRGSHPQGCRAKRQTHFAAVECRITWGRINRPYVSDTRIYLSAALKSMEQLANIFGLTDFLPVADPTKPKPADDVASDTARLIPGSNKRRSWLQEQPVLPVRWGASTSLRSTNLTAPLLADLAPATLFQIARDAALICAVYVTESQFKITILNWAMLVLYGLTFLSFANQAKLYAARAQKSGPQVALAKILGLTTLVVLLALKTGSENLSPWPLFVWSGLNWLALSACRQPWRSVEGAPRRQRRRVMIIGDSSLGRSVAEALGKEPYGSRIIQEFLLDRCLREPFGAEMMKRIARQECIDEVIIATPDRAAARIALREAKQNQLDAMIVPDLQGTNARCVEYVHMLTILLANPDLRSISGKKARARVQENYLWDDVTAQTEKLYFDLMRDAPIGDLSPSVVHNSKAA